MKKLNKRQGTSNTVETYAGICICICSCRPGSLNYIARNSALSRARNR